MSGSGRPLLAARAAGDDTSGGGDTANPTSNQNPSLGGRPKRTLIESACAACRKRKSRCDGLRPTCTRCQNLRTECNYEAEEGESRWSALKRRNQALEAERDDLREIFSFLRFKPEQEALEVFRRIRSDGYAELLMMARQARESGSTAQRSSVPHSGAAREQRLPPIRTMVDVSGSARAPGRLRTPSLPSDGSTGSYSPTHSAFDPQPLSA